MVTNKAFTMVGRGIQSTFLHNEPNKNVENWLTDISVVAKHSYSADYRQRIMTTNLRMSNHKQQDKVWI